MNKKEATKATRNGAIVACITAGITILMVGIAITSDATGSLAIFNDPVNFFDVGLVLLCAFGMYKKSRAAAVTIFIYFLASKIIIAFETQQFRGIGLALVFLYFYAKAIQGSFVYHRIEKSENPDYKPSSKLWYVLGIPLALVLVGIVVIGVLSTTGIVPSTRVLSTSEISSKSLETLQSNGIVLETDEISFFYSQGLTSVLESGNFLTQNAVILYLTNEYDDIEIYEIPFSDVTEVTLEQKGSILNDSIYMVSTADPDNWLQLFLSTEQKGDEKFVAALREKIGTKQNVD